MTNTIQTDNALMVTVPSGATYFRLTRFDTALLCFRANVPIGEPIPLLVGEYEYEILGLADQITEEQARLIVGDYIDFIKKEFGLTFTPAEAMVSFLKSHNLIASTTLVLKRK